jgi:predicted TIM-barrel fold metal-dependent hydrolase
MLDATGIQRAVVLSDAYYFDSPLNAALVRSDTEVLAENDWTAQEVARFPERLIGFCSFNPLRDYALAELERCAKTSIFKSLKLHFGGSVVDLKKPAACERVRHVFEAANSRRLSGKPFGAVQHHPLGDEIESR